MATVPGEKPVEACRRPGGRGVDWIGEGFELFKQDPGNWIGIFVIWLVISSALSLIMLDIASAFLNPIFSGGILLGCRSLTRGKGLRIGHLFEAFKGDRVGALILMVVIQLAIGLAAVAITAAFAFLTIGGLMEAPEAALEQADLLAIMLVVLLLASLFLPLMMMSWFAPALIVLRGLGAWDAMLLSFRACLLNWLPLTLYGLVSMLIIIVAIIPLLLGLIVAVPVLTAAVYASYRDIFPEPEPAPEVQAVST